MRDNEMSLEDKKRWLELQKQEELSDLPVAMAVPSNEYNDLPVVAALPTEETTPPVLGEERTPSSSLTSQKAKDFVKKIREPQAIEQPLQSTASETKPKYDVKRAFEDAQTASTLQSMMGRLGKAGAQIGAGIAGGTGPGVASVAPKVDTSISDELVKDADSHLKRFAVEKQLQEEAEQRDPNSPYSRMMKDFLLKHGIVKDPKMLENLPGHELDRILSQFVKVKGIEETAASRKLQAAALSDQRQFMRQMAEEKLNELKTERTNKQLAKFNESIDPTLKAGGAFAGHQKIITGVNRLKPLLFNPDGSIANPNKQMMEEIAITTANIIGAGGTRSRAQIEALVPDSYKGRLNDWLQKLTNEPVGRDQQKFVEQFAKLAEREYNVASDAIVKEIDTKAKSMRSRIRDKDAFDEAVNIRKETYKEPFKPAQKGGSQVKLPVGHGMSPGNEFKAKGKTYRVNPDSESATEI